MANLFSGQWPGRFLPKKKTEANKKVVSFHKNKQSNNFFHTILKQHKIKPFGKRVFAGMIAKAGGSSRRQDDLARSLTKILRHDAQKLKLNIRENGYVDLKEIFKLKAFEGVTLDVIEDIVKADKKGRFDLAVEESEILIRANQGHSLEGVRAEEVSMHHLRV